MELIITHPNVISLGICQIMSVLMHVINRYFVAAKDGGFAYQNHCLTQCSDLLQSLKSEWNLVEKC